MIFPRVLVLLTLGVAVGCSPIIQDLRTKDSSGDGILQHGELLQAEADIVVRSGGATTPVASVRPALPLGGDYDEVAELGDRTQIGTVDGDPQYLYTGDLVQFDYGAYELELRVGYTAWLTRQYKYAHASFLVEPPAFCFGFDQSNAGFALGPVRKSDGGTYTASIPLQRSIINWPIEQPDHASMTFDITARDFPRPPDEADFWFIDFISPDLSTFDAWQQAQGITFRMTTRAGGTGLYAQPLFYIEGHEPVAPQDAATGQFLLYPIDAGDTDELVWKVINWQSTPDLPIGTRQSVRIRIYGNAASTGLNDQVTVHLDGVCPVPPGVTPAGGSVVSPVPNPWLY